MGWYYQIKTLENGKYRCKYLSHGDEIVDEIMSKPVGNEDTSLYELGSDEGYIIDSLEEFIRDKKPAALWLDGTFYKKLETRLYVECRTMKEAQNSDIETSIGTAKEDELQKTDRNIIDYR